MKLSDALNDAICEQIAHELSNSIKYMQIASFFENLQLKKISKYFYDQSNHEKEHADKFLQYLNDRTGGNFIMPEMSNLLLDIPNVESVASAYVALEEKTTDSIEDLYNLAFSERSYIDLEFLQKMLWEQVEEEDSALHFYERIIKVKDLVIFDNTFGD